MYEKSKLLEILIKRCEVQGKLSISVNKFFIEVLKLLTGKSELRGDEQDGAEEILDLIALFKKKAIDPELSLQKIQAYLQENKESFLDSLVFDKILAELSIQNAKKVITACAVCERVLEEPTSAIAACFAKDEAEPESELITAEEEQKLRALESLRHYLHPSADEVIARDLEEDDEDESDSEESDDEEVPDDFESLEDFIDFLDHKPPAARKKAAAEAEKKKEDKNATISEIMEKVDRVHSHLTQTVFGQDHAILTFVSGLFQAELTATVFEKRNRPRATFLFAGPPGVGKTYLSEQAALALGLPFKRFDMSEYSDKEANFAFCGSDKVYKDSSKGNVTGFVAEHPECVLLFDEVEKAHLNVIYLFLQMLDAGRLRDNYTDEEVSFTDTIIIFTTNAGRRMYEDESINLVTTSKKTILKALSAELNPNTGVPLFPLAICSRFASGNVVMFNRMEPDYLLKIAGGELQKQCFGISKKMGIRLTYDRLIPYAMLFAEGGKADARSITAKCLQFIHDELYELFRLMKSESNSYNLADLKAIRFELSLPKIHAIRSLFERNGEVNILVLANKTKCKICQSKLSGVNLFSADSLEAVKDCLMAREISLVLCDITYKARNKKRVLNSEDIDSLGMDFFDYMTDHSDLPVYLLAEHEDSFGKEELESFSRLGAKGVFDLSWQAPKMNAVLKEIINAAHLKRAMLELARGNKILSFGTIQKLNKKGNRAVIALYDFKLSTAIDAQDNDGILNDISKPDVHFNDVIGAKDAKEELSYFIQYLKDPMKYVKRGIKAPKGILLYGPSGTGKTLLAKAMAGESDVTFIKAEGNQFLKSLVGQGPESVHQLFATARKYAPAILFIDEIDAIAKDRQTGYGSNVSGDVLTAFLTEMDGFDTDKERPVFVLAATNFNVDQKGALDPALLRRFDRRIYVDLPNREERVRFLELRLSKLKQHAISREAIDNLAVRSTGSSLAELDSVFELALRNVIKSQEGILTDSILEEAFETFNSGEIKKWNERELLRTARHEAGHAVVCWASGEKPSYLTIVARGTHGGYMQNGDAEDKGLYTKQDLLRKVRTALGGRAAELEYYGEEEGLSSGASSDLQTATNIVEAMICKYGMDEEMGLCVVDDEKLQSSYYANVLTRINVRLKEELAAARKIISENQAAIDSLVQELLKRNSLKGDDIERILTGTFSSTVAR